MQILDVATVADLVGASWPVAAIEDGQWYDTTADLLAWSRRTFPEAGNLAHHVFAALVHTHVTSWSAPWMVDGEPLYEAGERLIRHARGGAQGRDAPVVEWLTLDGEGRHVPPGGGLAGWTAWVWGRLVALILAGGAGDGGEGTPTAPPE